MLSKEEVSLGFSVAGKSGTAQKYDPKLRTYSKENWLASYIGFAPAHNPYFVVYVLLDSPRASSHFGGLWARPAAYEVFTRVLKYISVAPQAS
jgi:cell division protein FtsI/penicillin-binding protein 2